MLIYTTVGSNKHLGEHGSRPLRCAPCAVRHYCVAPPLCRTRPPLLGPWCTSSRLRKTSGAGHRRMSLRPRDREIRLGAPSARARNRVIPPPPRAGPLPHEPVAAPCEPPVMRVCQCTSPPPRLTKRRYCPLSRKVEGGGDSHACCRCNGR